MLSPEQVEHIDEIGLRVLEEAGIVLEDDAMCDALASRGCRVEGERVWLPQSFVEERIQQAPGSFDLYHRDGTEALTIGGEGMVIANSGVDPHIYDLDSGELRDSTIQDVRDTTKVLDALTEVGVVLATLVEPTDVPGEVAILTAFEATLRNTTKPIIGPGVTNRLEAEAAVAIGVALRGGRTDLARRPFFAPWLCPLSPLTYHADLVDALRVCAEAQLPLAVVTNPMTGLTAPLTLVGALAQMHAELLATIVLAQEVCPGLPALYQPSLSTVDLHTLAAVSGSPEAALTRHAGVLLGRHRGLPTTGFGLGTMSRVVDVEYGYEKSANGLACALAGPSILGGIGQFGDGVYASYESLIIDHEIVGFLRRLTRGVQMDNDEAIVSVIKDAMEGDEFVTHPHTRAHLRDGDYWTPTLGDTLSHEEWLRAGEPEALSRAHEKAEEILANHWVPAISGEAERRLEEALRKAKGALLRGRPSEV